MSKLTFETSLLKSRMPRASSRPRDIRLDSFWRDSHALTKLFRITCKKETLENVERIELNYLDFW